MSKSKIKAGDVRTSLIELCNDAVAMCGTAFRKNVSAKKLQGLEKLFQDAFMNCAAERYPNWAGRVQVNRAEFGGPGTQRKGWVDAILVCEKGHGKGQRVAVEFKVCELPRTHSNSPYFGMYDVGQLAIDFRELAVYRLDHAYCIAILFGGVPRMPEATPQFIQKTFHNLLFADFETARQYSYLKAKRKGALAKREYEGALMIGLDKPFFKKKDDPMNFCRLYPRFGLAVVGFCVRSEKIRDVDAGTWPNGETQRGMMCP